MEVEPRIVKQYKCHHCGNSKNYRGKGIEGGEKKKVSLHRFLADQKKEFKEKMQPCLNRPIDVEDGPTQRISFYIILFVNKSQATSWKKDKVKRQPD